MRNESEALGPEGAGSRAVSYIIPLVCMKHPRTGAEGNGTSTDSEALECCADTLE